MRQLRSLLISEGGAETMEYTIVAVLGATAALTVVTSVAGKVLALWHSINGAL